VGREGNRRAKRRKMGGEWEPFNHSFEMGGRKGKFCEEKGKRPREEGGKSFDIAKREEKRALGLFGGKKGGEGKEKSRQKKEKGAFLLHR